MNKKTTFAVAGLTVASAAVLGIGSMVTVLAADEASNSKTTFIEKIAAKLGVDKSKVETALSETRTEMEAAHRAEMQAKIAEAVKSGKLTQKEANILNALAEIHESLKGDIKPEVRDLKAEFENLTEEQRKAKMDEVHNEMQNKIISALKAKNLEVSADELKALQEKARELELGGPGMIIRAGRSAGMGGAIRLRGGDLRGGDLRGSLSVGEDIMVLRD